MYIHKKKYEKHCFACYKKSCKHPFYKALKKKRKHKKDEKGRGRYRFFEGSRTVKNSYKSSVYRGLRWKGNEKRAEEKRKIMSIWRQQDWKEEDIWQQNPTMFQDLPVHGTMPSNQHKHWISVSHSHFCSQPLTK